MPKKPALCTCLQLRPLLGDLIRFGIMHQLLLLLLFGGAMDQPKPATHPHPDQTDGQQEPTTNPCCQRYGRPHRHLSVPNGVLVANFK